MHFGIGIGIRNLYIQPFLKILQCVYHHLQQNKIDALGMDSKIFPNLGFAYSDILFYHYFLFTHNYSAISDYFVSIASMNPLSVN